MARMAAVSTAQNHLQFWGNQRIGQFCAKVRRLANRYTWRPRPPYCRQLVVLLINAASKIEKAPSHRSHLAVHPLPASKSRCRLFTSNTSATCHAPPSFRYFLFTRALYFLSSTGPPPKYVSTSLHPAMTLACNWVIAMEHASPRITRSSGPPNSDLDHRPSYANPY